MKSQVLPDTNEQQGSGSSRLRKDNIMDTYIRIDHRGSANKRSTSVWVASNRPSGPLELEGENTSPKRELSAHKGSDSIPLKGIANKAAAASASENVASAVAPSGAGGSGPKGKAKRSSRQMLEELEARLSARDFSVLQAIRKYRFLTSSQIGRLYITDCSTKTSQTRQQNLLLQRLQKHGLINALSRRIGGMGGGSAEQVWHLTNAGHRLLLLHVPGERPCKRIFEPSTEFLSHTLAVAECAVNIYCLCRERFDLSVQRIDTESACWRKYPDDGRIYSLRPDLFVGATCLEGDDNTYENCWFVEVDLSTESLSQVLKKCNAYLSYYYTGIEQNNTNIFPFVVWIAKDKERKERIKAYLKEHLQGHEKLFIVITMDEIEQAMRMEIDYKELR